MQSRSIEAAEVGNDLGTSIDNKQASSKANNAQVKEHARGMEKIDTQAAKSWPKPLFRPPSFKRWSTRMQ